MLKYYLALGDSITAGYGVGIQNFAAIYYSYLHSLNPNLRYANYGVNGLTTNGLAYMLLSHPHLRELAAGSEIITITVGANDLLKGTATRVRGVNTDYAYLQGNVDHILGNMGRNLDNIGRQIRQLNPGAAVKIGTIYHPVLPYSLIKYVHQVQGIISQANKIIISSAKRYGFGVIPIARAFAGKEKLFIGPDHIHPNFLGHRVIAKECIGL